MDKLHTEFEINKHKPGVILWDREIDKQYRPRSVPGQNLLCLLTEYEIY